MTLFIGSTRQMLVILTSSDNIFLIKESQIKEKV